MKTSPSSPVLISQLEAIHRALPGWHMGVEARDNQAQLVDAAAARAAKSPDFFALTTGLLLWAWQQRPLDKPISQLLRLADQQANFLAPPLKALLAGLDKHLRIPTSDTAWHGLVQAMENDHDPDRLTDFLLGRAGDAEHGLFWLGHGFEYLLDNGLYAQARQLLHAHEAHAPDPIIMRLRAELALFDDTGAPQEAADTLRAVDPDLFPHWRAYFTAQAALGAGNREQALPTLAELWQSLPWHVNLALKLHDLIRPPVDKALPLPPDAGADTAVLLYSWNKAPDLERTLESLLASNLYGSRVTALNNGSSDHTAQVLARAEERFRAAYGPDSFETITLPVNVGAPAARNWLLAHPRVKDQAWAAFLDDDIELPGDWLGDFLRAARAHPKAGALGRRVVSLSPPPRVQAADFHILPPALCRSGFTDFKETVYVNNTCIGARDVGLFDYTRPCVSVTGCCHMLNMEAIRAAGPFDLRFTPSQFDDLERDLRSLEAGFPCLYLGGPPIRHVQHSSLTQASDRSRQGHVLGNKIKLGHLWPQERAAALAKKGADMVWEDLKAKLEFLVERFG